jgi:hypothetical protein
MKKARGKGKTPPTGGRPDEGDVPTLPYNHYASG